MTFVVLYNISVVMGFNFILPLLSSLSIFLYFNYISRLTFLSVYIFLAVWIRALPITFGHFRLITF